MTKYSTFREFYILILVLSIVVIVAAIYIQYVIGAIPCSLCKYQRIPYIISIFICILGLKYFKSNLLKYLLILIFIISFILSAYHFGIENNIFPELSSCTSSNLNILEKEELLQSLKDIPPNCKDVNFKILNLSLATFNVLISLSVVIISIILLIYEKNR